MRVSRFVASRRVTGICPLDATEGNNPNVRVVSLKFGSFIATVSDVEPERSVATH